MQQRESSSCENDGSGSNDAVSPSKRAACFAFFEYTHTTQDSQHATIGDAVSPSKRAAAGVDRVEVHGPCASPFLSILTRHRNL